MANHPHVSIIVINYKSYELTINCVNSLKKLIYPNYNIIIVDNGSPNDSYIQLKTEFSEQYTIIGAPKNEGFAAGCNIGAKEALKYDSKYILVLNNDTLIEDQSMLDILVAESEKRNDCAWIGPKILTETNEMQGPHFKKNISYYVWKNFGERILKKTGIRKALSAEDYKEKALQKGVSRVYRITGACMLISLKSLESVDFFDENTFLYHEEEILAEKFQSLGKYCYFTANTHIRHIGEATIKNPGRHVYTKPARDSFKYYISHYRNFNFFERNLILFSTHLQNLALKTIDRFK